MLVPPPAVQVAPPAPPPAPQFAPAAAPASAAPVAAPQPVAAAFDYEKRAAEQLDFIDESDDAVVSLRARGRLALLGCWPRRIHQPGKVRHQSAEHLRCLFAAPQEGSRHTREHR